VAGRAPLFLIPPSIEITPQSIQHLVRHEATVEFKYSQIAALCQKSFRSSIDDTQSPIYIKRMREALRRAGWYVDNRKITVSVIEGNNCRLLSP
jgi:hypothetical protein